MILQKQIDSNEIIIQSKNKYTNKDILNYLKNDKMQKLVFLENIDYIINNKPLVNKIKNPIKSFFNFESQNEFNLFYNKKINKNHNFSSIQLDSKTQTSTNENFRDNSLQNISGISPIKRSSNNSSHSSDKIFS